MSDACVYASCAQTWQLSIPWLPAAAAPVARSLPSQRRCHMPKQPSPEIIGPSPPGGVRPFGIVTQTPSSTTPAGKAGLKIGDALLSFGNARARPHLETRTQ